MRTFAHRLYGTVEYECFDHRHNQLCLFFLPLGAIYIHVNDSVRAVVRIDGDTSFVNNIAEEHGGKWYRTKYRSDRWKFMSVLN